MLGKILKVGVHEGQTKVKTLVTTKEGGTAERTNVVAPEAVAAVTALVGQETNLRMKKDDFGTFIVIGVGEYEKANKGGFKKGSFSKTPEDPAKQLMIVKQNALGHATALAIHNAKGDAVSVETVLKLAQPLVDFVMSGSGTNIVGETKTTIKTKVAIDDEF